MQANSPGGLRGFLQSKVGRVVFVLLAVGVVFGTVAYVSTLLAIPVMLLVGLALPIYAGLKRPRFLALAALVVLVAVAPLATVVFSQELLVTPTAASSAGVAPVESGGPVLQNASVSPFSASSGTNFTWTVAVYPKFLDGSLNGTNWSNDSLHLFVSTCPGATDMNDSNCPSGYSLITKAYTFPHPSAPRNGTVVTFQLGGMGKGIWSWQMELLIQNLTNPSNPAVISLVGDPTYDSIEGPIVGGLATAYTALIGTIYEVVLVYLGLPFYFILLLYMWYKGRERRRNEMIRRSMGGAGTTPPTESTPSATGKDPGTSAGGSSSPPSPPSSELTCGSCGAVVYANEAKCWKCGSALGSPNSLSPLPSKPS